jgi:predicted lipoprotein with Yx(FWY)xxD motif
MMKKWGWLFTFLLAGILLAGCSSQENAEDTDTNDQAEETTAEVNNNAEEASADKLQLMEKEEIGNYLADAEGMALYYFAKDEPNTSNCSGECLENWPAFYSENLEVPEGFNKDDFGTITREDTGEKQTTYKGYPLYYFVKDEASGDVNGQGVKDVWFIVNSETTFEASPSSLKLMENKEIGKYLTDAKGMALYYFAKDEPNTTKCSGECLGNWPAFYSENLEVPEGFNKEDFGTITREDTGKKQTTYKGYPLYYFVKDKASSDVNGQGVKDVWFIVNSETTFAQ